MRVAFANLRNKPPCWSLMDLAQAYLDSALVLCDEIKDRPPTRYGTIFSLMPIANALHQGLENFLKGASLRIDEPNPPKKTHCLKTLWEDYRVRLENSQCNLNCLLDHEIVEIVSWWDRESTIHTGPGEGPRFLNGKDFKTSYSGLTISEDHLNETARRCKDECVRVHIRLIQESIPGNPIHIVHPLQPWWEPDDSFEKRIEDRNKELGIEWSITMRINANGESEVLEVWEKGR